MIVVDANLVVRWFVREDGWEVARQVLGSGDRLAAPDLVLTELASVMCRYARRGTVPRSLLAETLQQAADSIDVLIPTPELFGRATEIALELGHALHDCVYLATAEIMRGTLVTSDAKLVREFGGTRLAPLCRTLDPT